MSYSKNDLKKILVKELPRLRRFAYSLTGNKSDADDLVQNLIVKMLNKGIPDSVEPVPWLLRVCKNMWLDEIRARDVRVRAVQENKIPQAKAETLEEVQEIAYSVDQILEVLQSLPEEQRAIISLVIVEGFSYNEAAEVLEIPKGTVMSRLSRARHKLLDLLEKG
ncbi:MAG: sigma-70 family RNA polymerase sigma factor [Alteromonadaceae bacterium]|nr:sigma-70 family RNA polymerase sigma factor [Alteromonadaceae bacterium]